MEPSRQTAARRRRELLALSREIEAEFGPDTAAIVHEFEDGWTIRRLTDRYEQLREGELMHSCLRFLGPLDENCWSLRDPDNLPHATFAVWSVAPDDDLDEIPDGPLGVGIFGARIDFVKTPRALVMIDAAGRPPKPDHRCRLFEFGSGNVAADEPRFPTNSAERILTAARALDPRRRIAGVWALPL